MEYLVMEVHPAYAVLMDQKGRFRKAANLHYAVGDKVTDPILLEEPKTHRVSWRAIGTAAIAACLCVVLGGGYWANYMAYGTIRVQINPDVLMTVSRMDRVLGLEALNPDGEELIHGFEYSSMSRDEVTDQLVARAMEMGYLNDGGAVRITVDGGSMDWQQQIKTETAQYMESWQNKIAVSVGDADDFLDDLFDDDLFENDEEDDEDRDDKNEDSDDDEENDDVDDDSHGDDGSDDDIDDDDRDSGDADADDDDGDGLNDDGDDDDPDDDDEDDRDEEK